MFYLCVLYVYIIYNVPVYIKCIYNNILKNMYIFNYNIHT